MTISHDSPSQPLPPLKKIVPPVVHAESLAAVNEVTLRASDVPPRILRNFYECILGMKFVEADIDGLRFVYERRRVFLSRAAQDAGNLVLLVKEFSTQLVRLREQSVPYELIHGDAGMTHMAYLRDPAHNIIQLVETRAL